MSVSCWFSFLLWASICLVQAWWHLVTAASMVCWSVIVVPRSGDSGPRVGFCRFPPCRPQPPIDEDLSMVAPVRQQDGERKFCGGTGGWGAGLCGFPPFRMKPRKDGAPRFCGRLKALFG